MTPLGIGITNKLYFITYILYKYTWICKTQWTTIFISLAIGTIITEIVQEPQNGSETESTLVAVLQTLAAGTLLYVAFFEVII